MSPIRIISINILETPLQRIAAVYRNYPRQFWLMFVGMFISTIGSSMIWPFLMIYVSSRLQLPLFTVATLLTLNSAVVLVASFMAGPIVDRFGRKWMMVASLALNSVYFILLSQADVYSEFAALMAMGGIVNPVYRIGADAMMADLVPPEKRIDAYALLRLSNNTGIAIGPAIGGFIASTSYNLAFYIAATGMFAFSLLLLVFARETLPKRQASEEQTAQRERWGGYPAILQDRAFIIYVILFTLVSICTTLIWMMMPVYAKQNYGVLENLYGLIPTTNALMVVFLQVLVTSYTKKMPILIASSVGAFFYAVAVGSVALATSFSGFWICMVIMTIGELIIVPTSSSFVANLAPADKRGRYMSLYGLSWSVASGIGSLFGGLLDSTLGPKSIWYGGLCAGMLAVVGMLIMNHFYKQPVSILTVAQAAETDFRIAND